MTKIRPLRNIKAHVFVQPAQHGINAADANEKLFCVTGKSGDCINKPKGCMCPTCPLAKSLYVGVKYNTYCLKSREMEQRQM